jgi:hypothetical protein
MTEDLPPGATEKDRILAQADAARRKMNEAHAAGNRRHAELWSTEERRLLGLAYGNAPIVGSSGRTA